jgi:hypothetical protein
MEFRTVADMQISLRGSYRYWSMDYAVLCGDDAGGGTKSPRKIFEGPGQKQIGTADHAPSPSIQTHPAADGRPEHTPLFLSRPTFSAPAIPLRKLSQHVQRLQPA